MIRLGSFASHLQDKDNYEGLPRDWSLVFPLLYYFDAYGVETRGGRGAVVKPYLCTVKSLLIDFWSILDT
jgi:hypothetical protein